MFSGVLTTILLYLIFLFMFVSEASIEDDVLLRRRRRLLYPNSTLLQFNAGIGTPTPADMVNVNWAIQANFQLPWNRTQIPIDILHANSGYTELARRRRDVEERGGDYENDAKLYHFYKYVEGVMDGFGHNGTSCVLQTLCRLGAEPLHTDHDEDLLHELASYILNPTNDLHHGATEGDEAHRYIEAYRDGERGGDCKSYGHCSTSLVDMFTVLKENKASVNE